MPSNIHARAITDPTPVEHLQEKSWNRQARTASFPFVQQDPSSSHSHWSIPALPSASSRSSPAAQLEGSVKRHEYDPWSTEPTSPGPSTPRSSRSRSRSPSSSPVKIARPLSHQSATGTRLPSPTRAHHFSRTSRSHSRGMDSIPPSLQSSWQGPYPPLPPSVSSAPSQSHAQAHLIWDASANHGVDDNQPHTHFVQAIPQHITHRLQGQLPTPPSSLDMLQLETAKGKEKEHAILDGYGGGGAGKRVDPMPTAVWAAVMDTSKGRDKVLKCVQYTLKTYLYVLTLISRVRPLNRWLRSNQKRMKIATSGLSLTRKCLLLAGPLHPLTTLLSPQPTSATALLNELIDFISAVSDDIYCFGRLGLVNKRTGAIAEKWSTRAWFLTTLMNLYKLHLRTIPAIRHTLDTSDGARDIEKAMQARKELRDAELTGWKLWCDMVFVSYDTFHWTFMVEPVQCVTGLVAAFIATGKLYDKHWSKMGK